MDEELLEHSWLFDDATAGAGGRDDRLLPPPPSDAQYDERAGVGAATGGGGGLRGGAEVTQRAARQPDDGGGWRCLNNTHPEDCRRCVCPWAATPAAASSSRAVCSVRRSALCLGPHAGSTPRSCLPAPRPADATDYVLVGDKGVKSGAAQAATHAPRFPCPTARLSRRAAR